MNQTKIRISAPQAERRLRGLWDDRVNIHNNLISLAQQIEMYGEVGAPERQLLEWLYFESREMTCALKELMEGIAHGA